MNDFFVSDVYILYRPRSQCTIVQSTKISNTTSILSHFFTLYFCLTHWSAALYVHIIFVFVQLNDVMFTKCAWNTSNDWNWNFVTDNKYYSTLVLFDFWYQMIVKLKVYKLLWSFWFDWFVCVMILCNENRFYFFFICTTKVLLNVFFLPIQFTYFDGNMCCSFFCVFANIKSVNIYE